jgi:hypothetical protein
LRLIALNRAKKMKYMENEKTPANRAKPAITKQLGDFEV